MADLLRDIDGLRARLGPQYYGRAIYDIFLPKIRATGIANRLVFQLQAQRILTTNFDPILNYAAPVGTPTYTWKEVAQAHAYVSQAGGLAPLLKVHGCAYRADTLVLSVADYEKVAADDVYRDFIRWLLHGEPVLFLGFGLNDPFDLDRAIRSAELAGPGHGPMFVLTHADGVEAIRKRHESVHCLPYTNHADVPAIMAALVRAAAGGAVV